MKDELDDLSALARRGALSGPEQKRLAMLLESSPESSLLHRAGAEFDREDIVLPGDDALAERIAQAALARLPAAAPARLQAARRKRRLALLFLAAALATSAALAATIGVFEVRVEPAVVAPTPQPAPELPAPVVTPLPAPAPSPEPTPLVARAPRALQPSAAELFAAASRARREGESQRARALYGELTRRFADTHEAHAARMALGLLELAADPRAALAHFEAYLGDAGDRALRAEALWGKSQALRALGRSDEARSTLELLVKEAPGSAYAPAARARLAAPTP